MPVQTSCFTNRLVWAAVWGGVQLLWGCAQTPAPPHIPSASPSSVRQAPPLSKLKIGDPLPAVSLRQIGAAQPFTPARMQGKVWVGVFAAHHCSMTEMYAKKLKKFIEEVKPKGVEVVVVHAFASETDAQISAKIDSFGLKAPILVDREKRELCGLIGVTATPAFFIVDKEGRLRYRGAFDNQPTDDAEPYLRPALAAVLAGKQPGKAETHTFGCGI